MQSVDVGGACKRPKTGVRFDIVKRLHTRTVDGDVRRVPEWMDAVRQNHRATTLCVHGPSDAQELESVWTDATRSLQLHQCKPEDVVKVWNARIGTVRCLHWHNEKEPLDLAGMDLSYVTELHVPVGHMFRAAGEHGWTHFCAWIASSRALVDLRLDFQNGCPTQDQWTQLSAAIEQQPRLAALELVRIFEITFDFCAWIDQRKWIHFGLDGVVARRSNPYHWPPSITWLVYHKPIHPVSSTRARLRLDDTPWHDLPLRVGACRPFPASSFLFVDRRAALVAVGPYGQPPARLGARLDRTTVSVARGSYRVAACAAYVFCNGRRRHGSAGRDLYAPGSAAGGPPMASIGTCTARFAAAQLDHGTAARGPHGRNAAHGMSAQFLPWHDRQAGRRPATTALFRQPLSTARRLFNDCLDMVGREPKPAQEGTMAWDTSHPRRTQVLSWTFKWAHLHFATTSLLTQQHRTCRRNIA